MLSYSRGALLAVGDRHRAVARARAAAPARARRCSAACWSATVPARRLGVRAGRPDRATARRWRCASTPARASARCCPAAGGDADRRRPRRRLHVARHHAAGERAARAARAACCRRARGRPRGRDPAAGQRARAASTGRSRRRGSRRPTRRVAGPSNSPERLTATSSGRAALLARGDEGARRRPRGSAPARASYGDAAAALPHRRARPSRHAHGYVVQTLADLGWVGLGALAAGALIAWLAAAVARARAAPARPRAALGRRARRAGDAGRRRDRLRRALGDRLDVVRARQRRARAAVRRLGRLAPAAARAASSRPEPAAAPRGLAAPRRGRRGRRSCCVHRRRRAPGARCSPCAPSTPQDAALERLDQGALPAGGVDRPDRPRPQPARGRAAVRPRGDRAGRAADRRPARRALEQAIDLEPANPEAGAGSAVCG